METFFYKQNVKIETIFSLNNLFRTILVRPWALLNIGIMLPLFLPKVRHLKLTKGKKGNSKRRRGEKATKTFFLLQTSLLSVCFIQNLNLWNQVCKFLQRRDHDLFFSTSWVDFINTFLLFYHEQNEKVILTNSMVHTLLKSHTNFSPTLSVSKVVEI